MNYFKTRTKYMLANIFNNANKDSEYVLVAIVFNKRIAEYEIYKFYRNQFSKTELNKNDWSSLKYLEEIAWEDLRKISNSMLLVKATELEEWKHKQQKCYKYKILKNIYNAIF